MTQSSLLNRRLHYYSNMKAKQKHTKKASAPETRTWDSLSKDEQAADVQAHYDRAAKASASQNCGKWIKEKRASGKEYWIWISDAPEAQPASQNREQELKQAHEYALTLPRRTPKTQAIKDRALETRIVIEYGDKPYIVKQGEREIQRFARCDKAEQFADGFVISEGDLKAVTSERDELLVALDAIRYLADNTATEYLRKQVLEIALPAIAKAEGRGNETL
jgi:hypothetical protein